jgi:nucleolar protein 56
LIGRALTWGPPPPRPRFRLIAHAGSLTKLSKCPASTVQILGAEKALFRALKSKGNTPKFGLLFNSTYISRAATKNKGRISRYLANKCAIASRIDAFSDVPNKAYGESLKEQVEDRLKFYETGETPEKNLDVMLKVKQTLKRAAAVEENGDDMPAGGEKKKKKDKKKQKVDEEAAEVGAAAAEEVAADEDNSKSKKKKKSKDE